MAKAYFDPQRPEFINIEGVTLQRDWSRFGGAVNMRGLMEHYMEISIEDDEIANFLTENDYPVKMWIPKNSPDQTPERHLKIFLPYNDDPKKAWLTPIIKMINIGGGEPVDITKENVNLLDSAIVDHADITLRKFNGKSALGVAYTRAQLVYANIYISGTKVNGGVYRPSYAGAEMPAMEPGQTPDDMPF